MEVAWRNMQVRGESVPVVDGTAVYHLEQATHVVAAVRKSDGVTLWRRTLPVTNPDADGYGLALAGGHLVVGDLDVFGLDPASGEIRWTFVPSQGQHPGYSALTAVGDVVYSGSTSGHVYAIDAKTGTEKWVRSFHEAPTQVFYPRVVDGVIYAGITHRPVGQQAAGGVVAIDVSGSLLWKTMLSVVYTFGGAVTSGVAVIGSEVVIGGSHGVFFLDRATGAVKGSLDAAAFGDAGPADHRVHFAPPHLLIGTATGKVFAFDPATRTKVWQRNVLGSVLGFSSDGSRAYVSLSGRFHALRLSDGAVHWTMPLTLSTEERFLAPPALDGDLIHLAGSLSVYALRRE